jgi:hypothetical protein
MNLKTSFQTKNQKTINHRDTETQRKTNPFLDQSKLA